MSEQQIDWVGLTQGSPEWHEHRRKHFNASEAGAVIGVNPWFPHNPAELFDLKTGVKDVFENSAMAYGSAMEAEARTWIETAVKESFTPEVAVKGRYSASYDGICFDGKHAIEIKCPMKLESKLFSLHTANDIRTQAANYWWQLVHQMYVKPSIQKTTFLVYHPEAQKVITIDRDEVIGFFDQLAAAWEAFGNALDKGERPEEEAIDESEEFQALVTAFKVEKLKLEAQEKHLAAVEEELKAYAKRSGKTKIKGFGVNVTQVTRQGNVNYKNIPELKGVDLDKYRGKTTTYWSIK